MGVDGELQPSIEALESKLEALVWLSKSQTQVLDPGRSVEVSRCDDQA